VATADLLLHPVRLRILQTLSGAGPLTTSQLRDRLPDVPPATLYRHVAMLADAGVLEVAAEKRVRGAVERSYRLREEKAVIDPAARAAMTREEHRRAFTAFSASLIADFDRYLAHDSADPTADGVAYRQAAVWLTEEENAALVEQIAEAVTALAGNTPDGGRTRRYVSLVVIPDKSALEPMNDDD
jgi:DNA-binding transcriptional ArsR family regulator